MAQSPILGVEITGYGMQLPEDAWSNQRLIEEKEIDSSNDWIVERTGIETRYMISGDESNTSLAAGASRAALKMAGIESPYDLGYIISGTWTPDYDTPGTAVGIHRELGAAGGGALDVNTACASFVNALNLGYKRFMTDDEEKPVLVTGSDILSRQTDWDDRSTAILFGDGAGAVVLERTDREEAGLLAWKEVTDSASDMLDILYVEGGRGLIKMKGQEVFKRAVKIVTALGNDVLKIAEMKAGDLDHVVLHQANQRIISAIGSRLGVEESKMADAVKRHANTSSASVPMALAELSESGKLGKDQHVLAIGFGAGMSAAAALIRT